MAVGAQLLVDLGATWLRAELRDSNGARSAAWRMQSGAVVQIEAGLHRVVREAATEPALAVLGVPGRVLDPEGTAQLTYLGDAGLIDFREVFGGAVGRVRVMNDLEAGVRGVLTLEAEALHPVQGPQPIDPEALSAFVVAMPGTGLGIGLGGARLAGTPSEAGNMAAAIDLADDDEVAAAAALSTRDALPSYQDLTCAGALEAMAGALADPASEEAHGFLAAVADAPVDRRPHLLLSAAPPDAGVGRALRVQARLLARAVQSTVLTVLPEAVFLGGGYLRAAWDRMEHPFQAAFRRSGAHALYLAEVPIHLADVDDLNLRGLRAAATELAGS